jgi:hypothetical protein
MAFTFLGQRFESVALARLVATLKLVAGEFEVGTCTWTVVAGADEDGYPYHTDCGAETVIYDRGFVCTAGHEHVNAQTRHEEGWDYYDADDPRFMFV